MRRLSFYLFLVFVFTVPWQSAIAIGGSKTLSSFVGVAALLAGIVALFLEGKVAKPPAFVLAFGVLVLWQIASCFWSVEPDSTLSRAVTMVQLLAMAWLATELCTTERERLKLIEAFVLGCVVVCLVLAQAYLSGQPISGYRYAPAGFNANESADVIAAAIPLALLVATSYKRGFLVWLNIAYIPLAVFAMVLTASRSGFIATCVGLVSVFFALRHTRTLHRIAWSAVMVAAFASLFFAVPVSNNLETNLERITFSADEAEVGTLAGRTTIWEAGLESFAEHPFAGTGLYTFRADTEARLGGEHAPHNVWLETAVETGIVGLLLLVATWLLALVPVFRHRDFRMGFHLCFFLVLLTTSLVANLITSKSLWIGLAILSATGALRNAQPASEVPLRELGVGVSASSSG